MRDCTDLVKSNISFRVDGHTSTTGIGFEEGNIQYLFEDVQHGWLKSGEYGAKRQPAQKARVPSVACCPTKFPLVEAQMRAKGWYGEVDGEDVTDTMRGVVFHLSTDRMSKDSTAGVRAPHTLSHPRVLALTPPQISKNFRKSLSQAKM